MKVALLNAHTSYASGVSCSVNGIFMSEYMLSCQINKLIIPILDGRGISSTVVDGSNVKPYDKSLSYKVVYVNASDSTIAIETHFNSTQLGLKTTASGTEILYGKDRQDSKKLAQTVIKSLREHLPFKIRREESGGLYEHGSIWILRSIRCPVIIVEVCFLTNPMDSAFLVQPRAIDAIAHAISEGIVDYKALIDGKGVVDGV